MKILSRWLLKAFFGPFVLTFCIVLFVLMMQFLWVYVDDFVGKGLEWYIIAEVLFYASASFVPLALPLAVLLSSIMTFGNLGEFYELTAVKSAGVSLWRFARPLTLVVVLMMLGALYFANTLLPISRLKFGSLLYDIQQKKPALSLKPGRFYTEIENYAIRIGKKSEDNKLLEDILIYDHSEGRGNTLVIVAKRGQMEQSADERFLKLKLYEGYSYEELAPKEGQYYRKPHMRTRFEEQEIQFDLSAFTLKRTDEELWKDYYAMLNLRQLTKVIDSLEADYKKRNQELLAITDNFYQFQKDSLFLSARASAGAIQNLGSYWFEQLDPLEQQDVLRDAINNVQSVKGYTVMRDRELEARRSILNRHYLEGHRKFSLSFACLLLFLVGAPLGAIIRRGGLGLPMLFSIVLFLIYHVVGMTSEKLARDSLVEVHLALWISSLVLLPIGVFLLIKSNNDSRLFDAGSYKRWLHHRLRWLKKNRSKKPLQA